MIYRRVFLLPKQYQSCFFNSCITIPTSSAAKRKRWVHCYYRVVSDSISEVLAVRKLPLQYEELKKRKLLLIVTSNIAVSGFARSSSSLVPAQERTDNVGNDGITSAFDKNEFFTAKFQEKCRKYDNMMELFNSLMNKEVGTFLYPSDYTISSKKIVNFMIHFHTTTTKSLSSCNSNDIFSTGTTTANTLSSANTKLEQVQDIEIKMMCRGINASIYLLERIIQEYTLLLSKIDENDLHTKSLMTTDNMINNSNVNTAHLLWFYSRRIWNQLVHKWKLLAMNYNNNKLTSTSSSEITATLVMSPSAIIKIIKNLSVYSEQKAVDSSYRSSIPIILLRRCIRNANLWNNLAHVLISQYQQESYYTAPVRVEAFIKEHSSPNENNERRSDNHTDVKDSSLPVSTSLLLQPNIHTYKLLLQAWVDSNHPSSTESIDKIVKQIQDLYSLQRMKIRKLSSTTIQKHINDVISSHLIAQRYYRTIVEDLDSVEVLYYYLQSMDEIFNNVTVLSEMIQCYSSFSTRCTIPAPPKKFITKKQLRDQRHACYIKTFDTFQILFDTITSTFDRTKNRMIPLLHNDLSQENIAVLINNALHVMNMLHTLSILNGGSNKKIIICNSQTSDRIEHNEQTHDTLLRAEKLLEQMKPFKRFDCALFGALQYTMLKIYANTYQYEKTLTLFEKIKQSGYGITDKSVYLAVINMYSNLNQPERSEQFVLGMLRKPSERNMVDIDIINSLIAGWAKCGTCDRNIAAERASQIYLWIFDHPICSNLKLQPTIETYTYLFQCLAEASKKRHSSGTRNDRNLNVTSLGSRVEELLNDMEQRYNLEYENCCLPCTHIYNTAINACLNSKEYSIAERLLKRMESRMFFHRQFQPVTISWNNNLAIPNLDTYISFLKCYSSLGTWIGAVWAEQLHDHMRTLSCKYSSFNHIFRPDVKTYNIVLMGWLSSNSPDATDRIWKIYEQMIHVDRIQLDAYNYTTIISALSKSNSPIDTQRSIEILQIMQIKAKNENQPNVHPDGRHYCMVLNGCVRMNDVDNAAHVMNMFVDAYFMQLCRSKDHPDGKIFDWIISQWIEQEELVVASWFLIDTITANVKYSDENNFIGPKFETVMKLYDAWKTSNHVEKDKYVSKMDTFVLKRVPLYHTHENYE